MLQDISEDISEQFEVNEVYKGPKEHPNDGKNPDELATGQAEPSSKRKKADKSAAEEGNPASPPNKVLSS